MQADVIVASPLALATRLAEDAAAHGGRPSADVDFLSSIELLVIDRADMLSMQVHTLRRGEARRGWGEEQGVLRERPK
eukprot:366358-Chlamydomonas_euryale.AAC.1